MEKTRLGIPILFHEEALHGFMVTEATSFPQAIALERSKGPVGVVDARELAGL